MKRSPLKRKTPLRSRTKPMGRTFSQLKPKSRLKKIKPINKRSAKRKVDEKEYLRLREEFLKEHPRCEVCLCRTCVERVGVNPSTEVHHKALRGKFLLHTDTWLAVCHDHHEQITANRRWAESCGFSLTTEQIRKLG